MNVRRGSTILSSTIHRLYCTGGGGGGAVQAKSKEEVESMVNGSKVVLFMKGTPAEPMCGFSRVVAQILRMHDVKYKSFNVLDDASIREGVKKFSEWPTIPQLYVDGKFVGGADITVQMHQNGELMQLLKEAGIKSAMIDKKDDKKDKS